MSSEYRDIVLAHNDILQLFCIITSRRRCTSHLEWKWPSGKPRKLSKFSARQIWRKLAYILEQLATQVDRTKIREYSFQLAMLLPELAHVFDQIDCLCKVGFIMDALTKYYNAPSSTFEVNRMALRTFVDEYFTQLQCDLRPLSSDSLEFSRITDYWKLDKSAKDWKVVHAFRIQNKIECRAFLQLKNRKLLWHASSGNNWVTIFRYGLCIEHANHGLYGAGVYFADMVCESLFIS
uniref:Poly [ADP-ribose] polymerase n=1 Tax=Albugo laibachii Nc14 TaxID=890382 RepID=F0WC27_9STRA|nr:PREDICTED: poly (ADPribose) polymerase family putati [Albugo laibachii Nc14]|eukprot:CCA18708.1 PREDICTED: poly (ADPribose) polymerase family putati [Albugo laibachii Nc14]